MCLEHGVILEFILPGRGQMNYFAERRACLSNQGYEKTIPINYKMDLIQDTLQPVTFLKILLFHRYFSVIF